MSDWSPFLLTRYEHLTDPVIWLPPTIDTLESGRSVYLPGSRGTGKTTLLSALSYSARLENRSLRNQLGVDAFSAGYIGLYMRLPDYITRSLDVISEDLRNEGFSLVLELQIVQLLFNALAELRDAGVVKLSFAIEQKMVGDVLDVAGELIAFSERKPDTLRAVATVARRCHQELQSRAFGRELSTLRDFPLRQVGGLLQAIAAIAFRHLQTDEPRKSWRAIICLDEAECLLPWQQIVLNTIVRLAKAPLSFVIAYVTRALDAASTLIPNLRLNNADRTVLQPLEDVSDASYRRFCTEVLNLYLKKAAVGVSGAGEEPLIELQRTDLEALLGPTHINALLEALIRRNQTERSVALLTRAEGLRSTPFFAESSALDDEPVDGEEDEAPRADTPKRTTELIPPPIYQAYLIDTIGFEPPPPSTPRWQRRQQESREIRKKMVAAMLAICDQFKWDVPYVGYHVGYQLSDSCIRDFLDIMHFLYASTEVDHDVAKFTRQTGIARDRQARALRDASQRKLSVVQDEIPHLQSQVMNLISSLGELLHTLHSDYRSRKVLVTPERGIFLIKLGEPPTDPQVKAIDYIQRAIDGGAVKLGVREPARLSFTVHHLLAPRYGFSYRGPYYETELDAALLIRCAESESEEERRLCTDELIVDVVGRDERFQRNLFPE
jgi:Cdc6-like AAA superfamily ATPase